MAPQVLIPTARGSANRDALIAKTGVQFQVPWLNPSLTLTLTLTLTLKVPYLVDPNTGVELFESLAIVEYLDAVYTAD